MNRMIDRAEINRTELKLTRTCLFGRANHQHYAGYLRHNID